MGRYGRKPACRAVELAAEGRPLMEQPRGTLVIISQPRKMWFISCEKAAKSLIELNCATGLYFIFGREDNSRFAVG